MTRKEALDAAARDKAIARINEKLEELRGAKQTLADEERKYEPRMCLSNFRKSRIRL
jgi:hypothetical protein